MFAEVKPDMRIAQEEIFGPVTAGTIGAEIHLPFGGTKGNGHREAGEVALDVYTG